MKQSEFIDELKFRTVEYYDDNYTKLMRITKDDDGLIIA